MPELPEVRALSERLGSALVGQRLTRFALLGFWSLKTVTPAPSQLEGGTLESADSRGKFLSLRFGARGVALVHLGQAGRVDLERPAKGTRPRGSLVRLEFEDAGVLVREHGTERRAGIWILGAGDPGPTAELGPEPFDEGFSELILAGDDARRLSTMLRDQHTVAGIGRGYADDILHRARLSPFGSLSRLSPDDRTRLLEATRSILDEALDRERARSGGLSESSLGDRFVVHRRAGAACPACADTLRRVSFEDYELVYCATCQTHGKVLADRRLSRLLR
ncbi:MAG TPA: DNA-formamidopyrimidine glycosylase family protein [Acidimicrobiales bacterium]|nr:DNA-formamidopyrimidine glycosylase family protein [Acidimicrobiales bacterium]